MDDVVRAALWGFLAASALPLGALFAMRYTLPTRTVGAIMAFGAGTLITAVTFELVDQAFKRADLWPVVLGLGMGAIAFHRRRRRARQVRRPTPSPSRRGHRRR